MRQLSLQSSTDDPSVKRHKHKQKCGDELCKHRKHKKRRKHKKHHHRELNAVVESPTNSSNKMDEYEFDDDDDDDEEADAESVGRSTVPKVASTTELTQNSTAKMPQTKPVNIKINKLMVKEHDDVFSVKDEILTEEDVASSITEDSSGSSYVSTQAARALPNERIIYFCRMQLAQNPGKSLKERHGSSSTTEKQSKMAAFLPARQLWAWSGKGYKRNTGKGARNRKQFYKTIQRGKETISVGIGVRAMYSLMTSS